MGRRVVACAVWVDGLGKCAGHWKRASAGRFAQGVERGSACRLRSFGGADAKLPVGGDGGELAGSRISSPASLTGEPMNDTVAQNKSVARAVLSERQIERVKCGKKTMKRAKWP